MKKKMIILFLILIFPFAVNASDDVISSFDMDIYVDNEGSAHVTETWEATANMGTEFYHSYNNLGKSKIINFTASMDGINYTYIDDWDVDESLSYKSYKNGFNYTDDGVELCFGKTLFGKHTYIIKYTITNFVVELGDSQMIYWTLLPENNGGQFKQVHIKIYSDEGYKDDLDVWGYGNKGGTCYVANGYIEMNLDRVLNDGEYMTILVKYPSNTFNLTTKLNNNFDYYYNLAEEGATHYGDIFTVIKNKLESMFKYIIVIWNVIAIPLVVFVKKKNKNDNSVFTNKYYRDFPSNDAPAVVEYITKKSISANSFSTAILDMIYKRAIQVETAEIETGLLKNKKEIDYIFTRNNNNLKEELTDDEVYLIDELFVKYSTDGKLHLSTLKNASKTETSAKEFVKVYDNWKSKVTANAEDKNIYEDVKYGNLLGLFFTLTMILSFISTIFIPVTIILLFESVILFIVVITTKRRTKEGNELYLKWMAFKNFLKDFGSFKDKELPEINLWEKYLVYAHVFGLADKLQKEMKIKIPELYPEENLDTFDYLYLNSAVTSAISSNISGALSEAHNTLASEYSSGGGGFSSGGGGGGSFGGGGGAGGR